jgi:hypothetical protein
LREPLIVSFGHGDEAHGRILGALRDPKNVNIVLKCVDPFVDAHAGRSA